MNIALVSEFKVDLRPDQHDLRKVIRAASAKPFGFMPFYPGPRARAGTASRSRKHDLGLWSVPLDATLASYDAVVVATAHEVLKDPKFRRGVRLVVDTRNMVSALVQGNGESRVGKG